MKILVAYNGYFVSRDAAKLANSYAKKFNAEALVVTTLETGHKLHLDDMEKADNALEQVKRHFDQSNIPCKTKLLSNRLSAGENIVQFARDNAVDLIMIGVKRRSRVGKMLLGSTAQYVILNAPCPVLSLK